MPRGKRKPAAPDNGVAHLEGEQVTATYTGPQTDFKPMDSGLGELSPADLAAIRGGGDEMLTSGAPASEVVPFTPGAAVGPIDAAPAEEAGEATIPGSKFMEIVTRLVTLEHQVEIMGKALENLAAHASRVVFTPPPAAAPTIRTASREEESAYFGTNLARRQQGMPQFGGIQEWRDAGSPVMEPKLDDKGRPIAA